MRVLNLFVGLGGWSAAFRNRGHEVVTIDIDYRFNPTYVKDVMNLTNLDQFGHFDMILASPPCQAFSIASAYLHWKNHEPDRDARDSIALVNRTLMLIEMARPQFWVMENPRGMLRHVIGKPQAQVSYCQYGAPYMKPTDLWGLLPPSFVPKMCKPKRTEHNAEVCSHEVPPRGSKAGTQGIGVDCPHLKTIKNERGGNKEGIMEYGRASWKRKRQSPIASTMRSAVLRAVVPYALSLAMCEAAEHDLGED